VGPGGIPSFKLSRDSCSLEVQLKNESVTFTNNPIPYLWLFGDGDSSTEVSPKHTFRESNNYTLTLITNPYTACADTLMQTYWINGDTLQELEIPNVFTPNDDGVNDCYRVRGLSRTCDTYKVSIYNRWGKRYFQTENPESCWNGKNEAGEDASPGVYYYIMEIKQSGEERRTLHGTLTLIRE
jgi:gliding motility-associated-like protein